MYLHLPYEQKNTLDILFRDPSEKTCHQMSCRHVLCYISAVLLSLPLGLQPIQALPIDYYARERVLLLAQDFALRPQGLALQLLERVRVHQLALVWVCCRLFVFVHVSQQERLWYCHLQQPVAYLVQQ